MTTESDPAAVLIVDDEQPLAELYARFLEPSYAVRTATGGTEALERMDAQVDVVLLDRRMPGRSGEEVLRDLVEEGYDCRIAMVTAVTPDVDIIEMGFDDYLTKPVDRTELIDTVDRLQELAAYDALVQKHYQLTSKKVALESETTDIDLAGDEEFARLTDRLNDVEEELQKKQAAVFDSDVRALLNNLGD